MSTNVAEIPTQASYVLTAGLVAWIKDTARANGKTASAFVRDLIEEARKAEEQEGEAA